MVAACSEMTHDEILEMAGSVGLALNDDQVTFINELLELERDRCACAVELLAMNDCPISYIAAVIRREEIQ